MIDNKIIQLTRISTIDALVVAIKEDVLSSKWQPNTQITEQELAERYEVSRHSIREALINLVNAGYLEKRINKGVFTRIFNEKDIRDIYNARMLIENEAIAKLTEIRTVPDEVRSALVVFKEHAADDSWTDIIRSDVQFHESLVYSLDNSRISDAYNSLMVEMQLINKQPLKSDREGKNVYMYHHKIVEQIEMGNKDGAKQSILEHLSSAMEIQVDEWKALL